jgi:transcriptional regulator with XRE-family HTH domain
MSIVQQLRQIIVDSGKTQVEIESETGIPQPTMSKFMSGKRGLRLTDIDKLAVYFGLELRPAEAPKKPAKKSRK